VAQCAHLVHIDVVSRETIAVEEVSIHPDVFLLFEMVDVSTSRPEQMLLRTAISASLTSLICFSSWSRCATS